MGGRSVIPACIPGLVLGTLMFVASLTPSLLPRTPLMQGTVSGLSFFFGYGAGVAIRWIWSYLELATPSPGNALWIRRVLVASCGAMALAFLWLGAEWQNSTRSLMKLAPIEGGQPLLVALAAAAVFATLLAVARLFRLTMRAASRRLKRVTPRRLAHLLGLAVSLALFWSVANGVFFRAGFRMADSSYQQLDALVEDNVRKPSDPSKTGSAASLVSWENLGRAGRRFVSFGPSVEDLEAFLGQGAIAPIRVYVGLNSAETPEGRARLALEELKRVNAFDRSVLVLVTPTGTGWVDPAAMDTVEYLHRGDVASVAVQYSYLASWLSLLTEPRYGAETARALFREVYGYWSTLPRDGRPKLYLHGLSLGALNSDLSADLFDVIGDPFHGALWSGPPFSSETWRAATTGRRPDSPAWLPRFRDGSIIRFTNQRDSSALKDPAWGPIRIVYLQYASDPITFFDPKILYRRPDWLNEPRGPDVSPRLRWFPVVTFLQLIIDMPASTRAPVGFGHVYAPEDYIDAWLAVTSPPGWSGEDVDRLKSHSRSRR
jgi:uncharacterized membrane protein